MRIIIGNFGDATELTADGPSTGTEAYYFIDNVSLSPLTEASPDVVLGSSCAGSPGPSSVTLGTDPMPDLVAATYRWTLPDGTPLANTPNLTVAPTQTTTYVLTVTINGQTYGSQATVTVNNVYAQNAAATYVAPAGIGPADLGLLGRITTIDASAAPYRGRVVFDGAYHVRGTVHLENGTFELRPGTTFLVDGASGLPYQAASGDTDVTTLVVQNASLELSGATLRASCTGVQWGGVWLERRGVARTQASGALRCRIQDAKTGVNSRADNEYYLADTDFRHNDCGLRELAADKRAVGGEGVQNCTFREGLYGIVLEEGDYYQYGNLYGGDYGAARFVGNDFADLTYMGISATAGRASFVGNQFRDCGVAAISTQGNLPAGPPELRANHLTVPAGSAALAGIFSLSQSPLIRDNVIEGAPAPLKTTGNLRVGIEFLVSMESGSTDQVAGNTVRNLDMALTTTTNDYDGATITIRKNTFQNNAADLVFYPYGTVNHPFSSATPVTATIRCNSFLNDIYSTVTDPIGIWLKDMAVIDQGLATSIGNGNEFQANQWLYATGSPKALLNDNVASRRNYLNYTKLQTSKESVVIQGNGGGSVNIDYVTSPAGACGGNPPGVNSRQAVSPSEAASLDSLRRENLTDNERIRLLLSLRSQSAQATQASRVEDWLANPNAFSINSQATIGLYLLRYYRQQHDALNADRIRSWFEKHSVVTDAELTAYLQLTKATDHTGSFLPGLQQIAEANRVLLQKVAVSGTTSARIACRLLRAYEATCPCVLIKGRDTANKRQTNEAELRHIPRLSAYPNPASAVLHVPYQLPSGSESAELVAYDALGRLVLRQNLVSSQYEVEVSTSAWAKGLYHLVILTGKQVIGQQHIAIIGN